MSLEKAEVLVIRQVDFSESSRVVTFFSREFGRFAALAKGAKRLKGPFDAALDLLSTCRIVFIRKSSGTLNLLTEARLVHRFQPHRSSTTGCLSSLYGGYYVAELLNGLTEEFDSAPEVFDLAAATLNALSIPESFPSTVIIHFEITLLKQIGLLPNLFECTVCGNAVESDGRVAHWVSQGGLLCANCRREEYVGAGTSISAASIEILRRMVKESTERTSRLMLSPQHADECHKLAVSAITQALGRRPATLRYIQI